MIVPKEDKILNRRRQQRTTGATHTFIGEDAQMAKRVRVACDERRGFWTHKDPDLALDVSAHWIKSFSFQPDSVVGLGMRVQLRRFNIVLQQTCPAQTTEVATLFCGVFQGPETIVDLDCASALEVGSRDRLAGFAPSHVLVRPKFYVGCSARLLLTLI